MRLDGFGLIATALVLVAGCSAGAGASSVSPAPIPAGSAAPSAAATRVEVSLSDQLRIEPTSMTVPAGVPVTFVVTNTGTIEHEFYLGDEGAQAAHEEEMGEMGGMTHDEPEGIAVKAGETNELTYTFEQAGETLAGCHFPGHYGGGMKATITVEDWKP
jgi:uncharacterized cupredoxin-like copper-binding protein